MPDDTNDYVTDALVRLVEGKGTEIGVTLVVDGTLVTRLLTPMKRYTDWHTEAISRGIRAGGHTVLRGLMEPLTKEKGAEIAEEWRERMEEQGIESEHVTFRCFALRNAEVQAGVPMNWPTFPYLLIAAGHVSALTLGLPG